MIADHGRAEPPDPARLRDVIREWILNREVPVGSTLTEREVVRRFGARPADARTALDRLAEEGTLTVGPGYTARVVIPSAELLRETDALRCDLEGLAARRFTTHAAPAQYEAMRRAVADFRVLAEERTPSGDLLRAHDRFYHVLLRAGGSTNTLRLLGDLRMRVAVVVCAGLADPSRAREMADELEAIHNALVGRDVAAAVAACRRHVVTTTQAGLDRLGFVSI